MSSGCGTKQEQPGPGGYRMNKFDYGRNGMLRHKVSAVYNFEPSAYFERLYPSLSNQACNCVGSRPVGGDIRSAGLWDEAVDEPIAYPFVAQDSTVPGSSLRSSPMSERLCYVPDFQVEPMRGAGYGSIGSSLLPGSSYMTWSESSLKGFGGSAVLSGYARQSGKAEDDAETCAQEGCKWSD